MADRAQMTFVDQGCDCKLLGLLLDLIIGHKITPINTQDLIKAFGVKFIKEAKTKTKLTNSNFFLLESVSFRCRSVCSSLSSRNSLCSLRTLSCIFWSRSPLLSCSEFIFSMVSFSFSTWFYLSEREQRGGETINSCKSFCCQ